MKRFLLLLLTLAPAFAFGQSSHEQNLSVLGVPPTTVGTYCVNWASLTAVPSYIACTGGGGGGGSSFATNGTALSSATTVNFQNSSVVGGLTLTFANPSAGNVQLGLSGWPSSLITNDCLTNNGTTISWGGCGGSNFQVNGSNLFSQTTVNFLNSSATNGQTFTFTNPTAGSVQLGVSGALTCGGGGTGLSATPANGQIPIGNGSCFTLANITAGANITVTNSAGGITIAAPGGTGVTSASGTGAVSVSPTTGAAIVSLTPQSSGTVLCNVSGSSAAPNACTLGAGLTGSGTTVSTTQAIRANSATTDTILSTDAGKLVTENNAANVAVTLPQATGSFGAGFAFTIQNIGGGLVTVTPTTSTINTYASLVIPANFGCSIVSDGTNYQVAACDANKVATLTPSFSAGAFTPNCSVQTNSVTATANMTVNLPTGCVPYNGQKLLLQIQATSAFTYTATSYKTGATAGAWPAAHSATGEDDFALIYSATAATPGWVLEAYNQGIP